MRIVLLNERRSERASMLRALPEKLFSVEVVSDEQCAISAITRDPPQIVVFSASGSKGATLARRLRGADTSGQAYLIAVFDAEPTAKQIAKTIAAGAHDFLRRPILNTELVERVNAPARLIHWAQSLVKPSVFDLSSGAQAKELRPWKDLGVLVAKELSAMVGEPFSVSTGWPPGFCDNVCGATIAMSLAAQQIEFRVSVASNPATLNWIRQNLLEDPNANDEATDDAMREIANMAGGSLKRALLTDGITLTTGIPMNNRDLALTGQSKCWTLSLGNDGPSIALIGEIIGRENKRLATKNLKEGMVLAHDVRNEGGLLLVPAGLQVTATTAAKLVKVLGPGFLLEVAPGPPHPNP